MLIKELICYGMVVLCLLFFYLTIDYSFTCFYFPAAFFGYHNFKKWNKYQYEKWANELIKEYLCNRYTFPPYERGAADMYVEAYRRKWISPVFVYIEFLDFLKEEKEK